MMERLAVVQYIVPSYVCVSIRQLRLEGLGGVLGGGGEELFTVLSFL